MPPDCPLPFPRKDSRHSPWLGGQAEFLAQGRHSESAERKTDVACTLLQVSISNHRPAHRPQSPVSFLSLFLLSPARKPLSLLTLKVSGERPEWSGQWPMQS